MPPKTSPVSRILAASAARDVIYATPKLVPTPEKTLAKVEKAIDAKLPTEIRAFYAATTELGLLWQTGEAAKKKQAPAKALSWNALAKKHPAAGKSGGLICIPPAEVVFQKGYWLDRMVFVDEDDVEIDGKTVAGPAFYNDLYPFDFVASYTVGLWFQRARKTWRIVLANDNGASWTDYRTITPAEYLAQLEKTLGEQRTFKTASGEKSVITTFPVEVAPAPAAAGGRRYFERTVDGATLFRDIGLNGLVIEIRSGVLNAKRVPKANMEISSAYLDDARGAAAELAVAIKAARANGFAEATGSIHASRK